MVDAPLMAMGLVALLTLLAELLHSGRTTRIARLAFGPTLRPALWARAAPLSRVGAAAALAWGLATLMLIEPDQRSSSKLELPVNGSYKHVLLILDVSPSMRLVDAGPEQEQSRMRRARDLLESFFRRIPVEQYRISVVAVYNGAKPVVIDTRDVEVVRNILGDLPMHYAFRSGKTRLFDGLEEAFELARPWEPSSTTVLLVSDGDTVPASGMPRAPASVADVLVIGVGDPKTGRFIDGRQSRQEVSTLRQIALRLGGTFHNGNEKHLSSSLIAELTQSGSKSALERLTLREYALIAVGLGATLLALLPLLLHYFGTGWRPGVTRSKPHLTLIPERVALRTDQGVTR